MSEFNFWELEEKSDGTFEMGGNFEPIPQNTTVHALCTSAEYYQYDDSPEVISLTWEVIEGDHKGRKVFQKIKINDLDDKKKRKAQAMLAAVNSNANGNLFSLGKKPEDVDLASALVNKSMLLKLGVWNKNDNKGNWVMAVSPYGTKPQEKVKPSFDNDLPF